jgi:3-dehydroquinate synthase
MTTVSVNASTKNYNIYIDSGLLPKSGEKIREVCGGSKALIVTDDIVNDLYADTVEASLKSAGYSVSRFIFINGEASKNIETYSSLLHVLSGENLTRSDVVVALGGGVVGDLSGFAAATYLRGIRFVQVPTTLLAMVDSSVGGKTAVNLPSGKNQVGSFYQPDIVLCDYDTLETLSEDIFRDGCSEVIKHAIIKSSELFELLKQPIKNNIEEIIARNVKIKSEVVALDEHDTGIRQILNFGHTIGHGIEKHSGYTVTHGSAVAVGMVAESKNSPCYNEITEMIKRYSLPYESDVSSEQLIAAAFSDKKRSGNKITMIDIEKIGKCNLKEYTMEELTEFIKS